MIEYVWPDSWSPEKKQKFTDQMNQRIFEELKPLVDDAPRIKATPSKKEKKAPTETRELD